jgi:hypothetical protein
MVDRFSAPQRVMSLARGDSGAAIRTRGDEGNAPGSAGAAVAHPPLYTQVQLVVGGRVIDEVSLLVADNRVFAEGVERSGLTNHNGLGTAIRRIAAQ